MKPILAIALLYLAINSETLELVAPFIIPYTFWLCVSVYFIAMYWKHRSLNKS